MVLFLCWNYAFQWYLVIFIINLPPKGFVHETVIVAFVAALSSGVNMLLERFMGIYCYRIAEIVYIVLSIIAKTNITFSTLLGLNAVEFAMPSSSMFLSSSM